MKKFKSFVALCLVMVMAFSFSAVAFAAEPEADAFADVVLAADETIAYQDDEVMIVESPTDEASPASTRSTCYNGQWVGSSSSGSFVVNSDNSGTVGITVSTETSQSNAWALISIVKPNGNSFKNDISFIGSESKAYTMYFAAKGNYTIKYTVSTTAGLRINCWIY